DERGQPQRGDALDQRLSRSGSRTAVQLSVSSTVDPRGEAKVSKHRTGSQPVVDEADPEAVASPATVVLYAHARRSSRQRRSGNWRERDEAGHAELFA